jgi:TolB protein
VPRLVVLAALAALLVAGCGGSSTPKGPAALVFVSTKDGDYAIFGADADGTNVHRLTKERGDPSTPDGLFFQGDPDWSPAGTKIVFASHREGKSHLYVMNADGTGTRRLTDANQDDTQPSWSPDGRWIAFAREGAIFRIPAAGGPARRVGSGPGSAADPAYSPDGTLIAYDYRMPGFSIREVYVMNADGTGSRRVTNIRQVSGYPAWSPDGRRLAFQSNAVGDHWEVYTVRPDGRGVKRVTVTATSAIQPAWTPGGDLGFARDGAIWVDRGQSEARLTSPKDNDSAPAWNPRPPK